MFFSPKYRVPKNCASSLTFCFFGKKYLFAQGTDPVRLSCIAYVHAPGGSCKRACPVHATSPERTLRAIPIGRTAYNYAES